MKDRIKMIRKHLGLNQAEFGEKIGVKQNTVGGYEAGLRNPSKPTILSICDKFHVNEDWLRFGEGEMFLQRTRAEELDTFFGEIGEGPNNFRKRLISVLAKLDEEDWKLLEEMAWKLVEEIKEPDQES